MIPCSGGHSLRTHGSVTVFLRLSGSTYLGAKYIERLAFFFLILLFVPFSALWAGREFPQQPGEQVAAQQILVNSRQESCPPRSFPVSRRALRRWRWTDSTFIWFNSPAR